MDRDRQEIGMEGEINKDEDKDKEYMREENKMKEGSEEGG